MKDLLERLRLWIIKALGGYDRQQILTYRSPPLQWMRPEIERVRAETHIPWKRACWMGKDSWGHVQMELAENLARQMIQDQFVVMQTTHDELRNEVVVRATVMVVSGKDVAIHEEWGPTPEYDDWRHLRPL